MIKTRPGSSDAPPPVKTPKRKKKEESAEESPVSNKMKKTEKAKVSPVSEKAKAGEKKKTAEKAEDIKPVDVSCFSLFFFSSDFKILIVLRKLSQLMRKLLAAIAQKALIGAT